MLGHPSSCSRRSEQDKPRTARAGSGRKNLGQLSRTDGAPRHALRQGARRLERLLHRQRHSSAGLAAASAAFTPGEKIEQDEEKAAKPPPEKRPPPAQAPTAEPVAVADPTAPGAKSWASMASARNAAAASAAEAEKFSDPLEHASPAGSLTPTQTPPRSGVAGMPPGAMPPGLMGGTPPLGAARTPPPQAGMNPSPLGTPNNEPLPGAAMEAMSLHDQHAAAQAHAQQGQSLTSPSTNLKSMLGIGGMLGGGGEPQQDSGYSRLGGYLGQQEQPPNNGGGNGGGNGGSRALPTF